MRLGTRGSIHDEKCRPSPGSPCWLVLAVYILTAGGCEEEPRQTTVKTTVSSKNKEQSGLIIGQRTRQVVNASPRLSKRVRRSPRPGFLPGTRSLCRAMLMSRSSDGPRNC